MPQQIGDDKASEVDRRAVIPVGAVATGRADQPAAPFDRLIAMGEPRRAIGVGSAATARTRMACATWALRLFCMVDEKLAHVNTL